VGQFHAPDGSAIEPPAQPERPHHTAGRIGPVRSIGIIHRTHRGDTGLARRHFRSRGGGAGGPERRPPARRS